MPTVPLGENPYLYQDGPTVPLRQQRTGTYAANTFGNRVFYTPEGSLPNSTLAPGLAPTAGTLLRQNLSGAGLAGAAVGAAFTTQSVYAQGGGLFQGLGAGLGSAVGAIGGQAAGAAAGAAVGGAAGSAVPGVGNVAGAGAGTVAGTIGGGLAGGAVGGSVGGAIGRSVDEFFWPSPAEPAIGIPEQPTGAGPRPARDVGTPAGALGAGPVVVPGDPIYGEPPYRGGQSTGVAYLIRIEQFSAISGWSVTTTRERNGPITNLQLIQRGRFVNTQFGRQERVYLDIYNPAGFLRTESIGYNDPDINNGALGVRFGSIRRKDGQPDTGGDPAPPQIGETEPDRAPNPSRVPYRPFGTDGALSPFTRTSPAPTPGELPWPERKAVPAPYADPLGDPFRAPEPAPELEPTPDPLRPLEPAPAPTPAPTRPTNPFNPGPGGPLPTEDPERRATPTFIPFPIPTQPLAKPDFQNPTVPVTVPVGFRQPATTPTGSPQQLINPTTAPQVNPNVQPQPTPTPQPVRIEQGNCCTPPPDQELIRRLEEIKKGIGVQGLPASVPDQIAKQNPSQIQISNLAELQLWQVKQLDGLMGRWPVGIPIPTPAGTTTVGMPNMAEAVAEMVGMMVSQQVTATQILNTSSRTLAQAGSATQQAHLAHLTAKANAEFLGFESRPSVVDMPLAYTPGQDPFDGLLNESVAKVRGFENADGQDLKSILAELLQAAAIIRAVYWRKLDPKGDLKNQIRQNIRGQGDFVDEAAAGGGQGEDWEAYLRDVEAGFRSATGDDNPYGRPPGEGPQIRDRSPKKDR